MSKDDPKRALTPKLFTVYYMNQEKVFEMRMLLDNQLKTTASTTKTAATKGGGNIESDLKARLPFLGELKGNLTGSAEHSKQREIIDNLEYINTRSRMLADVMEECVAYTEVTPAEGSLVYIPDVSLRLENEAECRALIPIMTGTFDGLSIPEAHGLDIGHMMQSMIKTGTAFKLTGKTLEEEGKEILLKIPIDSSDLFESHYSIDDLLIGRVDVIGIYKGEVSKAQLRSSYEYFQNTSSSSRPSGDDFIDGRASSEATESFEKFTPANERRRYIDVLAIIQPVKTKG